MTNWGLLLLAVYVGLGLSTMRAEKAARIAVLSTVAVVAAVVLRTVA
jgi:hypothetical protein